MNSSQNKRQKYEHSYKPWTVLKTRGRNMNTSTNHETLLFWELFMVCRSVHIPPSCFESCSWFVGVFIFHPLVLRAVHGFKPWPVLKTRGRNMNTPTKPWTALKTRGWNMNTPTNHEQLSNQEEECSYFSLLFWELFVVCRSVHISSFWFESCSWFVGVFIFLPLVLRVVHGWTALKPRGRNMNTPTNHAQLSKQEAEIWTLVQTMNSSQNKWQKYEQLSKQEAEIWTECSYFCLLFWQLFMLCRSVHISATYSESC
jgi:hypothetical protein